MAKFGANCQLLVDCWRDVAVGTVGSQPSLNYTGIRLELPTTVHTFLYYFSTFILVFGKPEQVIFKFNKRLKISLLSYYWIDFQDVCIKLKGMVRRLAGFSSSLRAPPHRPSTTLVDG